MQRCAPSGSDLPMAWTMSRDSRGMRAPLPRPSCLAAERPIVAPFSVFIKFVLARVEIEKLFIKHCGKMIALPEASLHQQPCSGGYRLVRSPFPALKVLQLEDLESFQIWESSVEGTQGEDILFPQLEELSIKKCPKLIDLPEAPKLSVLEIGDGKQEIFHWVDRYLSSLTKLILKLENTETPSDSECTSIVPVDSREKWSQKSPLTVMELRCCNSFFGSGALEPWDHFVHLESLSIVTCAVLVHWPEKVFESLVSLRELEIINCKNLTGYAQAPLEPSASKKSQHLPGLVVLRLKYCGSLVEMFNVPASLKRMTIIDCNKVESIFGKQQQGTSVLAQGSPCSEGIVPTAVSELSSSPMNHFYPCLEFLYLYACDSLPAVLHLPPSLKTIFIERCSSIQVLSCQLDGLPMPQKATASINAPEPPAAAATREHSLPPYLESLSLYSCAGMLGGTLRLPTSLKYLSIKDNSRFTSVESALSGEPPSLKCLVLYSCSTLASLPNEPQAYVSLWRLEINDCPAISCSTLASLPDKLQSLSWLEIKGCPAIKKLPRCLQQQLGSLGYKDLDAQYEVMAFKPKAWKEIPRLIRERKEYRELSKGGS